MNSLRAAFVWSGYVTHGLDSDGVRVAAAGLVLRIFPPTLRPGSLSWIAVVLFALGDAAGCDTDERNGGAAGVSDDAGKPAGFG